ncbi:MAG: hypothetical protein C5B47_05315 [Verrucomicrobia bacterium]|nr:MAG: hypothetical protein C5B47_05315 [Verrucomicrobiota bacterium]
MGTIRSRSTHPTLRHKLETSVNTDILGLPVEIGLIEKELGKLWEESAGVKTRASLINLVLYTESAKQIESDTHLIAEIASKHALRAIAVFANPSASESNARAWINAHCHTLDQGKLQICSEQITFQLEGTAVNSLTSVVFSHLDSDLPFCFWWQTEFPAKIDVDLWRLVDRLIFDSCTWKEPKTQSKSIQEIAASAAHRIVLCDLSWARLLHARFAISSLFDTPTALPYLRIITQIEIHHAPGFRTAGLLLLGWIATQLKWTLQCSDSSHFFLSSDGKHIAFRLEEKDGPLISHCHLAVQTENVSFRIRRPEGSEFYQVKTEGPGLPSAEHLIAAGKESVSDILIEELGRSGKHPLYCKALNLVLPLLSPS